MTDAIVKAATQEVPMAEKKSPNVEASSLRSRAWKRISGILLAAAVLYGGIWLFMQSQTAHAAEAEVAAPVAEEVAEAAEEPVAETSSRFSQAFDLIFKGDAREVVANANAELAARIEAADARETALVERELAVAKAEHDIGELQEHVLDQQDETKRQHEALTNCVLNAMKGKDTGGEQ